MIALPALNTVARGWVGPVLLALVSVTPPSHAADDEARRITDERARVPARFAERERECRSQFVVTSCVDDAKRERRAALDLLRADEIRLGEARRRQSAAARRAEIEAKAADAALRKRKAAEASAAASAPTPAPSSPASTAQASPSRLPVRSVTRSQGDNPSSRQSRPTSKSADARQAHEAESQAAFEARRQRAARHREAVRERLDKRRSEGKMPAAGLLPPWLPRNASSAPPPAPGR